MPGGGGVGVSGVLLTPLASEGPDVEPSTEQQTHHHTPV